MESKLGTTTLEREEIEPSVAPEVVEPSTHRRSRRVRRLVAGAAIAPLAGIAATYGLFFTPDSPANLQLSSRPAGTALGVRTGEWSIGSGSVAGYRVREKLLRLPASNDAVGRTAAITGRFQLEADGAGLRVARGMQMVVDVTRLESDDARRDDHMRTMAIETGRFPTATFVSTEDLVLPASVVAGGRADAAVRGDMTVHGVTRPVTIPVQAQQGGGRIEVVGAFSFGWDLFDMKQPNLSYVTVESDPTLEFQLFFDHASTRSLDGVGSEDNEG